MPDFLKRYKDPVLFLKDQEARSLTDRYLKNISTLSDEVLIKNIMDDILSITMYEKQFDTRVSFTPEDLTIFIKDKKDIERIFSLVLDSILTRYIDISDKDLQIRVINDNNVLQDAMDYCGVWYTDYDFPKYDRHFYLLDNYYDEEDNEFYLVD